MRCRHSSFGLKLFCVALTLFSPGLLQFPIIEFDGAGGISMTEMSRVEISGFEIVGPNRDITKEEAMEDRLLHSNYFKRRKCLNYTITESISYCSNDAKQYLFFDAKTV